MSGNPERPNEDVSPEDRAKWEQGAARYAQFKQDLYDTVANNAADISTVDAFLFYPVAAGCLQAIFLKEKPAAFLSDIPKQAVSTLNKYGLSVQGWFVYDLDLVSRVIASNPKPFEEFGQADAQHVMEGLAKKPVHQAGVARGHVLGVPTHAIREYERKSNFRVHGVVANVLKITSPDEQDYIASTFGTLKRQHNAELKSFLLAKFKENMAKLNLSAADISSLEKELDTLLFGVKHFNVNGIHWMDYDDTKESEEREHRLKTAFKVSGIGN